MEEVNRTEMMEAENETVERLAALRSAEDVPLEQRPAEGWKRTRSAIARLGWLVTDAARAYQMDPEAAYPEFSEVHSFVAHPKRMADVMAVLGRQFGVPEWPARSAETMLQMVQDDFARMLGNDEVDPSLGESEVLFRTGRCGATVRAAWAMASCGVELAGLWMDRNSHRELLTSLEIKELGEIVAGNDGWREVLSSGREWERWNGLRARKSEEDEDFGEEES